MNNSKPRNGQSINFSEEIKLSLWDKAEAGTLWKCTAACNDELVWYVVYYIPENTKRDPAYFFDYDFVEIDQTCPVLKLGSRVEVSANPTDAEDEHPKVSTWLDKAMVTTVEGEQKIGWIGKDVTVHMEPCK